LLAACSNGTGPGGGGGGSGSLVVTAATPASGNGTLSAITVGQDTITINAVLHRAVAVVGVVGAVGHSLQVYFEDATGTLYSANHTWGTGVNANPPVVDGVLACDVPISGNCTVAQVSVDVAAKTITLTNLVLPAVLPAGGTSTINGTISY
jgi:hypothetical protein